MTSNGKVIAINGNKLTLKMFKESSCAHCSGCGDQNKLARELEITYNGEVGIGDVVTFELADAKMLKIGFIVYVAPIIGMILGYVVTSKFTSDEKICVLISFLSLLLSFGILHIYDKFFVKEKVQMEVIKVEKADEIVLENLCDVENGVEEK